MELTKNQEIAQIICQQLGGVSRIKLFTGAKDFIAIANGVQFKMNRKLVRIVLNWKDYYDVEIGSLYNMTYTKKGEANDVDCDQLKGVVERLTGMYLSL